MSRLQPPPNNALEAEEEPKKLLEAAVIGCRALRQLADDPDFSQTFARITRARFEKGGTEFKELTEDLEKFESFLQREHEILIKCHVSSDIAVQVINMSRNALAQVKKRAQTAEEVVEVVRTFRDQACNLSNALVNEAKESKRTRETKRKILKILQGVAGAALVGLNAAALVPTGLATAGLTAAGGALSAALGGTIIQNAASPAQAEAAAR